MDKYTAPDLSKSALITIDTQNDFALDDAPAKIAGTKEILPNMEVLLDNYRLRNLLIVHIVRLYLPDGSNVDLCRRGQVEQGWKIVAPGTKGAELVESLKPNRKTRIDSDLLLSGEYQRLSEKEYIIYKPRWGAFYKTRLNSLLSEYDINTLLFTGCNYPNCPRTSIYQASERDFRIILVKDAISQFYPKAEEEMNGIGVNILTTREILMKLA